MCIDLNAKCVRVFFDTFDVPKDLAEEILSKQADLEAKGVTVSCPTSLPEEEGLYDRRGSRNFRKGDDQFFEKRLNLKQGLFHSD